MALAAMTSCSDQFLQDKKDYNGFNEEKCKRKYSNGKQKNTSCK